MQVGKKYLLVNNLNGIVEQVKLLGIDLETGGKEKVTFSGESGMEFSVKFPHVMYTIQEID